MIKRLLLFLVIFLSANFSFAGHIVGGEMYYDYLGNNTYRVYIVMYRDNNSGAADFDRPLPLTVRDGNGALISTYSIDDYDFDELDVVFNNPCVVPPDNIDIQSATYTIDIVLPPKAVGYVLTYQRCCRGSSVTNLDDPGGTGFTLTTKITCNGTASLVNSSPRFKGYPPLLICNNENLYFDHSAMDLDGDSLSYELISPLSGGTSSQPVVQTAPAPPYAPVVYDVGFSSTTPLGPGSVVTIDANTGALFVDASLQGKFAVGIRVKEYRNGVLIAQTDRDYLFQVINCVVTLNAVITPQLDLPNAIDFCQGTTITFDNKSVGATTYKWDFGVPTMTTDVSTAFEPTFTFPAVGKYDVTLIVNPGFACSDTVVEKFEVYEDLKVSFVPPLAQCEKLNAFDFHADIVGSSQTIIDWDFGIGSNPKTFSGHDAIDINFTGIGKHAVIMKATFGNCKRTYVDSIEVVQDVTASFKIPDLTTCGSLTQQFINESINANSYNWDFGDNTTTSDFSGSIAPTYTYPGPNVYTVKLVALNGDCKDSMSKSITVNEALVVEIDSPSEVCIEGNLVDFNAVYTGPPGPPSPSFTWTFGTNASVATASTKQVDDVIFSAIGNQTVTVKATYKDCEATNTKIIAVHPMPTVDFARVPGLSCVPFPATFNNLSTSVSELTYQWNFGDGNGSVEKTPTYIYANPGLFDVSLTVTSSVGCVVSRTMLKRDYINAQATPIANFNANPLVTSICQPEIQFGNQSQNESRVVYEFGEAKQISSDVDPKFKYQKPGTKNVLLIAYNLDGCSDSARATIIVEPISLYVPNTFTPDGDKFNNVFTPVSGYDLSDWTFKVFNRWGEVIFESSKQGEGWDGTYNGQPVTQGVYAFQYKYKSCENDDNVVEQSGFVNLMR